MRKYGAGTIIGCQRDCCFRPGPAIGFRIFGHGFLAALFHKLDGPPQGCVAKSLFFKGVQTPMARLGRCWDAIERSPNMAQAPPLTASGSSLPVLLRDSAGPECRARFPPKVIGTREFSHGESFDTIAGNCVVRCNTAPNRLEPRQSGRAGRTEAGRARAFEPSLMRMNLVCTKVLSSP